MECFTEEPRDVSRDTGSEHEAASLGEILQHARNEIFAFDLESLRFSRANRVALENTGYALDELRQLTPCDLYPNLQPGEYEQKLQALRKGPRDIVTFEGVHRRKDGSSYPVEEQVQIVEDGSVATFMSIVTDITVRKHNDEQFGKLERTLRRAQRLSTVGNFAAGIAHDLNNLLTPVLGHAELAWEATAEDHPAYVDVESVIEGVRRARQLIRRVLSLARRGESGHTAVRLDEVTRDALDLIHGLLPENIEFETHIEDSCPPVRGDATQLHQVVMSLCENARNAMATSGGVLELRTETVQGSDAPEIWGPEMGEGPYVQLTVRDSGVGMDKATVARIIDPFFTAGTDQKHTGLGLAVVHDIVSRHRGQIAVDSELGVGTTFRVYLPVAPTVQALARPGPKKRVEGSERILVIADCVAVSRVIERSLRSLGYAIETHSSSVEALEVFRADPGAFDVVLLNRTMPELTGAQLAEEMGRIRPDMPIVMMTGYAAESCSSIPGITKVIEKPFGVAELAATLREVMATPLAKHELNEDALANLSEREREVASAFFRGQDRDEISAALYISAHTVQNHFKSIFRKLGVHSKVELLRRLRPGS